MPANLRHRRRGGVAGFDYLVLVVCDSVEHRIDRPLGGGQENFSLRIFRSSLDFLPGRQLGERWRVVKSIGTGLFKKLAEQGVFGRKGRVASQLHLIRPDLHRRRCFSIDQSDEPFYLIEDGWISGGGWLDWACIGAFHIL